VGLKVIACAKFTAVVAMAGNGGSKYKFAKASEIIAADKMVQQLVGRSLLDVEK